MSVNTEIEGEGIEYVEGTPGPGISIRNLAHVVFKRKWIVLLFFIGSVVATAVIVLSLGKPTYVASSKILVSPGREHVSDLTLSTGGAVAPSLWFNAAEETQRTIEILTGRALAERVVEAIGPTVLYPKPQEDNWWLLDVLEDQGQVEHEEGLRQEPALHNFLENVSAVRVGSSSIVHLSFQHEDPELAAKVVNLLGEIYGERYLTLQKNPKADAFFQEQFVALKEKLAESEAILLAYKEEHGIAGSVTEEQQSARQQQTGLRNELNEARSKQAEIQSRDAELRRQLANTARTPGTIAQLRQKLTTLEMQENELSVRVTERHPTLISVREEIRTLRDKLSGMEGASLYGTTSSSGDDSLYANLQADVLKNEAESRASRAREQALSAKIAELQTRLDALEQIRADFSRLEKQAQLDQDHYRLYLTKFEEARISEAMDAEKIGSVRVLEPAHAPDKPTSRKRMQKLLLGIMFGGIGAIALAFALQFLGGSLDTTEDVERSLGLPVLASIPKLKRLAVAQLATQQEAGTANP